MHKLSDNILSWCDKVEMRALEQAVNISRHPCLIGNVCLMPDTHEGYGMPIGGVVALENAISPNMVGVDIGCGMAAIKTSIKVPERDVLVWLTERIRSSIPLSSTHHKDPQEHEVFSNKLWDDTFICKAEKDFARRQIGTLGGGNHFIELQKDEENNLWIMLHSGSRNLGTKVCDHYNKIANDLCLMYRQKDTVKHQLAFLPKGTEEFIMYNAEMWTCQEFAYANRMHMLSIIKSILIRKFPEIQFMESYNIHHNYVTIEHHFNRDVYVHRKGATLARTRVTGIIPGSQGTASYIVDGLGNEASLCSCSHGAGRAMSRTAARDRLSIEDQVSAMNQLGIVHGIRTIDDLDEAPGAYKNIDDVMRQQEDLVKIRIKLLPVAVVKG